MKRLLSLILVVLLVVGLAACGSSETKGKVEKKPATSMKVTDEYKGQFRAGFSRSDITPADPTTPLQGYGNDPQRIATGYITKIYTDAIAVSDEKNNTIIIIQLDLTNISSSSLYNSIMDTVSAKTGIPRKNIVYNCSHSHSVPSTSFTMMTSIAIYNEFLVKTIAENAVKALNDRKPANMFYGETETSNLNFVRHCLADDGKGNQRMVGDNHYDVWYNDNEGDGAHYIKHASDADPTLYMVKFKREDAKDIIVSSFRAHNTMTGGSTNLHISADWVGKFRDEVESAIKNCYCMYLQGNAGNINPTSRIADETIYKDYKSYGKALSEYAVQINKNYTEIGKGTVASKVFNTACPTNKQGIDKVPQATLVNNYFKKSGDPTATKRFAYTLGLVSPYEASAIVSRANNKKSTMDVESTVMAIGDLAFTFATGEMFCDLGHQIEEASPYKYTITCSYAGNNLGYIPTTYGFEYGCYESDSCPEDIGSGEILVDSMIKQLKELKKNTK